MNAPTVVPELVRRDTDLRQEMAQTIRQASQSLGLDERWPKLLLEPQRTVKANLPLRRDDGSIEIYAAYRCQYNNALGPYKGGMRYHPGVDEDQIVGLAGMMTWKNALVGLPFGGAKGGIAVDPRSLSPGELESLTRTMTRAFRRLFHPERDVPAPDVGTNEQTMDWIRQEYETTTGRTAPAVVTGKPADRGGLAERGPATGQGVVTVAEAAATRAGIRFKGSRIAIQGFGKVGIHAALTAVQRGATVVAVSDISGTLADPTGLPIQRLQKHASANAGLVDGFDGREMSEPAAVLETDCDILIPAALENQIHQKNAQDIHSKLVVEGANGPTTPAAADILHERGICVIPDILANAGGVILSHFEWQQGIHPEMAAQTHTLEWMDQRLQSSTHRVMDRATAHDVPPRIASYGFAVERVASRMQSKYPWLAS